MECSTNTVGTSEVMTKKYYVTLNYLLTTSYILSANCNYFIRISLRLGVLKQFAFDIQ